MDQESTDTLINFMKENAPRTRGFVLGMVHVDGQVSRSFAGSIQDIVLASDLLKMECHRVLAKHFPESLQPLNPPEPIKPNHLKPVS